MKSLPVIDFSAAPRRPWPGVVALLVAAGVLALQLFDVQEVRARLDGQREGMATMFVPGGSGNSAMSAQDSRRHAQIEAVATYLAAPWDTVLSAFEAHGKRGVVLRRLEPDAATGVVRMVGEASSLKVMMEYVLALEADQRLQQVLLVNHDALDEAAGTPGAVEFTLSAAWRPRTTGAEAPRSAALDGQAEASPAERQLAQGERP